MAIATATLTRGGTTVDIPLLEEGGNSVFTSDLGKPNANLQQSGGTVYPRALDNWSGLENITFQGRFTGANAYTNAYELVDLLVAGQANTPLTLDVDLPEYDADMNVCLSAGSDQALTVTYDPGRRNNVRVQGSLTRVGNVDGTDDRTPTTPTAAGSGPIQLRAGGNTVDLTADVQVERTVGRPNDVVRRQPSTDFPFYLSKRKPIAETFSLAFELPSDPVSDLATIAENIFRTRLGRSPVYLDFQGVYGLGEFAVLPTGSAPFRQVRAAGREGWVSAPSLELTRVYDPTA